MEVEKTMAKTPKSKKAKGMRFERECAKRIEEVLGVSAKRTPLSGAITDWKGDITTYSLPVSWECKNQERLNFRDAFRQAVSQASGSQMPVLLTSRNNDKQVLAVLNFEDLLLLMDWAIKGGWLKN